MDRKEPKTDAEWQAAVDAAHGALALDSARKYGLVTGGPMVDVDRCEDILRRGERRGWVPSANAVETFIQELLQLQHHTKGRKSQ